MNKPIMWSYWNHEPIYHLKRMGNDGGTVFSLGEWVDEWYDRIHSEELIKKGADLGINTIYTHYYKGSGLLFEKDEMNRTKELTQIAHKYGIIVLGYMSMGSIYTENITKEIPNVKDMLIIDQHGKYHPTLFDQYYRPRPCYNNEQYLNYLKKVIKYGIEEVGLDGFHFDNSTFTFCYCDNCQRKFKEFLKENFKNPYEVMGIKDFDYVEIPHLNFTDDPWDLHEITPKGNIHDCLMRWYMKFLRHTLTKFHTECFDYVKEVSGGKAKVLHNPGFPRKDIRTRTKGYEPSLSPASCDYVFVENVGGYFGKPGGRITGQTFAFKCGEKFGYKVFDTSWANGKSGKYSFPKDKEQIAGFLMQAAVYGGIVGAPWSVRSMKNGDEVAIDTPYLAEGLKESFTYFKENFSVYDTKSYGKIKLLHHPDNYICAKDGYESCYNAGDYMTENQIPYSVILQEDILSLKEGDAVVLPNIIYCEAKLYEDLKTISQKGVKIIAIGGFGHYNENTKGRSEKNEIYNLNGIETSIVTPLENLKNHLDSGFTCDTKDVLLETRITNDNKIVLNILNANPDRENLNLNVTFEDDILAKCKSFKVLTPDNSETEVEIKGTKAYVTVKNLKTLVSVIFEGDF